VLKNHVAHHPVGASRDVGASTACTWRAPMEDHRRFFSILLSLRYHSPAQL
jgi:hypothetical protein